MSHFEQGPNQLFRPLNGSSEGTLKITGYIRGDKINVNRLIHIPGWKDFQLEKIEKLADPQAFFKNKSGNDINMSELAMILPSERFKDDLVSENVPDPMDGEQNITEEDMLDAELGTSIGDNAGARNKNPGCLILRSSFWNFHQTFI